MKLEQSFEVQAPLQRVWEALIDVERVAPCLPGAAVTGRNDDGSYDGEFKVKIGPTSAAYAGKLQMEQIDEAAHSATMQAAGTDRRGQGGAKATIVSSVSEGEGGATIVHVDTDYRITGRLARFGRGGMIEEISNRLLTEFATSLQAMLAGDGGAGAVAAAAPAEPDPDPEPEAVTAEFAPVEPAAAEPEPAPSAVDPQPEPAAAEPEPEPAGEAAQTAGVIADEPAPIVPDDPPEPAPVVDEPGPVADEPAPVDEAPIPVPPAPEPAPAPQPAPAPAPAPAGTTAPPPPPPPPPLPPLPPLPPASEPLDGLALMRSVLLKRAKANPAPFAAVLVMLLVVLRLRRRRR